MMPIDEIKDGPMRDWSIENRIDEALVENERAKQQRELGLQQVRSHVERRQVCARPLGSPQQHPD